MNCPAMTATYPRMGSFQAKRRLQVSLGFDGTDLPFGLETLPIQRTYDCAVREAPDISLYFARIGRT